MASQPWHLPGSSLPKPRYITAMPSNLGNCMDINQVLTLCLLDLKLSYCMYFLCKEKVSIANSSQQATDLFPQDLPETSNYQDTAIESRSSTWMVRNRAAERSNDLPLSCTSHSHTLKTSHRSPVISSFTTDSLRAAAIQDYQTSLTASWIT